MDNPSLTRSDLSPPRVRSLRWRSTARAERVTPSITGWKPILPARFTAQQAGRLNLPNLQGKFDEALAGYGARGIPVPRSHFQQFQDALGDPGRRL